MKRVGIIGLGDMGIGLSRNIIQGGFELIGFDLREQRRQMLEESGGRPAKSIAEVGESSDVVFVMVLNGQQVLDVVDGEAGLKTTMKPGSTIIVSATIEPAEAREVESRLAGTGIQMIDTPVSGGKSGADAGTLTMMAAADQQVFDATGRPAGRRQRHLSCRRGNRHGPDRQGFATSFDWRNLHGNFRVPGAGGQSWSAGQSAI